MARAMGTNAYGKEPRRGERTLSRGFTHRRARRAFLRPYGAGASLGRSHRAYALGYFLVPLTRISHQFAVKTCRQECRHGTLRACATVACEQTVDDRRGANTRVCRIDTRVDARR